jgi:hypothetical protein
VSRFATLSLLQREIAEGYADERPSSSMAGFHAPLTGRFCAPHDTRGRSDGQEVVLAIRLRRHFFEDVLAQAVQSTYVDKVYHDRDEWKDSLRRSNVRLQWDPDHLPTGQTCERRAIQLGLRGEVLREYRKRQLVEVIDVSDFVAGQRVNVETRADGRLVTPLERVYAPNDPGIAKRIGLDSE